MATIKYKRDFKELEQRRRKGMRLLARGLARQSYYPIALRPRRPAIEEWLPCKDSRRTNAQR